MNVGAGSLLGALCTSGPAEPRTASLLRCIKRLATTISTIVAVTTTASMHQLLVRCFGPMVKVEHPWIAFNGSLPASTQIDDNLDQWVRSSDDLIGKRPGEAANELSWLAEVTSGTLTQRIEGGRNHMTTLADLDEVRRLLVKALAKADAIDEHILAIRIAEAIDVIDQR